MRHPLVCPYHHRLHHRGGITLTGPAHDLQGHRQRRASAARRLAGAPTQPPPARGATVPRAHRGTRRLVVVWTLPAPTTTNHQLSWGSGSSPALHPKPKRLRPSGIVRDTRC
jgi:hypothetical protein